MKGTYIKFYVHEKRRVHGVLLYEWLLEQARKLGIHGGNAFRGVAGFGRHGKLHEDHFYELHGDLPVEIGFAVSDEEAERLLKLLADEKVSLFYVRIPAEIGVSGPPAA